MTTQNKKSGQITLDLQDLLDVVSKAKDSPISTTDRGMEAEDLKRAWFNHVLLSMEKLSAAIEDVRRVDIVGLRNELKTEIEKVEEKVDKNNDDLTEYKKDVIIPLNDKIVSVTTKIAVWGAAAGIFGSALMLFASWIVKNQSGS